jgi:L,D-peptidoglycan transpeptidase YkuD (ErfK/YbiS/YcfS/YnhG family)
MAISKANRPITAFVRARPSDRRRGIISIGPLRLACALGRSGLNQHKREGDGATPRASLVPIRIFYRADQNLRPTTSRLPQQIIRPDDGWCDAPGSFSYNRHIKIPFNKSHERLWRDDHLYDLVIETDWNTCPRLPYRGSAIFIHLARDGYKPTEGCIALSRKDMRLLLMWLGRIRCFKIS